MKAFHRRFAGRSAKAFALQCAIVIADGRRCGDSCAVAAADEHRRPAEPAAPHRAADLAGWSRHRVYAERRRLEDRPARLAHLARAAGRRRASAAHARRRKRDRPPLVARRPDDRVHREARRQRVRANLSARGRRRRGAPVDDAWQRGVGHHLDAGRVIAVFHRTRTEDGGRQDARAAAGRRVCLRGKLQADTPVEGGRRVEGRGTDHERRLLGDGLPPVRYRPEDCLPSSADTAARLGRRRRGLGRERRRLERGAADQQHASPKRAPRCRRTARRCCSSQERTRNSTPTTTAACSSCPPAAVRRACWWARRSPTTSTRRCGRRRQVDLLPREPRRARRGVRRSRRPAASRGSSPTASTTSGNWSQSHDRLARSR